MNDWSTGLGPARATIPCSGGEHALRWKSGRLLAVDHGEPEDEATLAALAGERVPCLEMLQAWERRRQDPRVLLLGSRGPSDTIDPERHHQGRTVMYRRGGMGGPQHPPKPGIDELLLLGGGLPDRLQAQVAAAWVRRLRTGHRELDATRPLLTAALYGRLLAALRMWLGEPALGLELTMVDADAPRTLRRTDDGLAVELPFAWLSEVWARGLAVVLGRLCLAASSDDGSHWKLRTVGPDLGDGDQITMTLT